MCKAPSSSSSSTSSLGSLSLWTQVCFPASTFSCPAVSRTALRTPFDTVSMHTPSSHSSYMTACSFRILYSLSLVNFCLPLDRLYPLQDPMTAGCRRVCAKLHAGIQYRELLEGTGDKVVALGSKVSMKCAPLAVMALHPLLSMPIQSSLAALHVLQVALYTKQRDAGASSHSCAVPALLHYH